MVGLRDIAVARREDRIPERERPAETQKRRYLALQIRLMDGRHLLHEEAVERDHVSIAKLGIRRIRHRWIEMVAVLGDALPQSEVELGEAVVADTGCGIRRDVG